MSKKPIYVSTDIETDGPVPGLHSMLSIGSAAFLPGGELISTFYETLETLPEATQNKSTMEFWAKNPKAWEEATLDPSPPKKVMIEYENWVEQLPGKPIFVAWPLGFDWTFVFYYLVRFCGKSVFGWSGLDIKSYAAAALSQNFAKFGKRKIPNHLLSNRPHTHNALDDALEQGEMFINILKMNTRTSRYGNQH